MSTAGYWELALPITDDVAEAVTNFLWELGALGVIEETIEEATPVGGPRLRAFFPDSLAPALLERRVRDYLAELTALGLRPASEVSVTPLPEDDWGEAWRKHFRPLPVGRRLLVVPPWETPSPEMSASRLVIVIEPGRAFGTGHHATTAGCLECLEAIVERETPAAAIDLGTGSGILAVTAARLGVSQVLGVDEDPDAVACAKGNAERNRVADRVCCVVGDAAAVDARPAPLVLANLLTAAHRRLAATYAARTAPGGALVLGGILAGEADTVVAALDAGAFTAEHAVSADGWTTLVFRRRA